MRNKSQGEIFGIMLFFVIIIIGILISTQLKLFSTDRESDSFEKNRNNELAKGVLKTILDSNTNCNIDKRGNKLEDIIDYCIEYYKPNTNTDPEVTCEIEKNDGTTSEEEKASCDLALTKITQSLKNIFKETNPPSPPPLLGERYYSLEIEVLDAEIKELENEQCKELNHLPNSPQECNKNYRLPGYNRASTSRQIETSKETVEFRLFIYYK